MKHLKLATILGLASAILYPDNLNAQNLFSDNFDANTAASYTVNQDLDTQALFNYDYSADGIPSAPNSTGGSTLGVRFRANYGDTNPVAAAINISPTGAIFAGDYTLRYDVWLNANGPFPGGGAGSTEFTTAGVGNSGLAVQKSSGTANGAWFAADNEGGSGIDYRAYRGTALEGGTSTAYAAPDTGGGNKRNATNSYYHTAFPGGQTAPASQQAAFPAQQTGALKAGTLGFQWREVAVSKVGTTVTWTIDGLTIATLTSATFGGSNIFVGHWDVFSSIADNPATAFSVIDNLRVEAIPEPSVLALTVIGAVGGLIFLRRRK